MKMKELDLTRDGMMMSVTNATELAGSFTLMNAFVVDEPDVYYTVHCPAQSSGSQQHCTYTALDKDGEDLADCAEPSALRVEHIPAACLGEPYLVGLYAVP